jgi:signal transduction histidine kinase
MKKHLAGIFLCISLVLSCWCAAQQNPYWKEPTRAQLDSLKRLLGSTTNDSVRMQANRQLGLYYQEIDRPSAMAYYEELLRLARKLDQPLWEAEAMSRLGYASSLMQNYSGGLKYLLTAQSIVADPRLEKNIWNVGRFSQKNDPRHARMTLAGSITQHLGILHYFGNELRKSLGYFSTCLEINKEINDDAFASLVHLSRGESYIGLNLPDSAIDALETSLDLSLRSGHGKYRGLIYYDIGNVYSKRGDFRLAQQALENSIQTSLEQESPDFLGMGYIALSKLYRKTGIVDSSFQQLQKALATYRIMKDTIGLVDAHTALAADYEAMGLVDSAYVHLKEGVALKTAHNREERVKVFQAAGFHEQIRLQSLEAEQIRTQSRTRTYSLLAGIAVLLAISGIIYRNHARQKKARMQLEEAYKKLTSTQTQLIQSEKMASLGELTAGIAHEIQNPLNFVNNFSEINAELAGEIEEAIDKGDLEEIRSLAADIKSNQEKIREHGKRADSIVKGMLQHSRSSTGMKEPTDINKLTDEYLRLAYHGLRAKDKSFNVSLQTHFDPATGLVSVVPQDIGRVLLNLFNNAFYAVQERSRQQTGNYEPAVTLTTKRLGKQVTVTVEDNGAGIPETIKDKIFQPFFTTKPTGQGTGLGLSLSYDIVTKGHGGTLTAESTEGQGSTFTIHLPTIAP